MAATSSAFHRAENRLVYTYEPQGWPRGVLTGYEHDGGFFLEHVVVFPVSDLRTLLRLWQVGSREAWARGYRYIVFQLHRDHPFASGLSALATRLGFTLFREDPDGISHYVLWRKR